MPDTIIYLNVGGERFVLPVNPEEISVKHPTVDRTAEVAGVGEITIPQKPGLREVTIQSFFPGSPGDPYTSEFRTPRSLCTALQNAWKNRTRCRLIITRSIDYDTNMSCVITDFEPQDKGGEPDDIYFTLTLTEYRDYTVQEMRVLSGTELEVTATVERQRSIDSPQWIVGAPVLINGDYYTDGTGLVVGGIANNIKTTITRIVSENYAPYRVGQLGWMRKDQIQLLTE